MNPARLLSRLSSATLLAYVLLFSLLPAGITFGQVDGRADDPTADPDQWLTETRWSEDRYGLSIRQPIDSLRMDQPPDRAIARWVMPTGDIRISLETHQGMMADSRLYRDIELEGGAVGGAGGGAFNAHHQLKLNELITDMTGALESAGAREINNTELHEWVEVGDFIGYINYFIVHPFPVGTEPWLYGIALLQLDPYNVVVLRLECSPSAAEQGISILECMLHSIEVETSEQVRTRLRSWMLAGDEFMTNLTQEDRIAAMKPDRLYRIRELRPGRNGRIDDPDIGYMRIWQRYQDEDYYTDLLRNLRQETRNPDAQLDGIDSFHTQGNAVVIQSFYRAQGSEITRLQEYIAADQVNDIQELWNFRTELRQPGERRFGRDEGIWVETGVRDDLTVGGGNARRQRLNRIQVVREGTPPRQIAEYVLARERDPRRRLRFPSAVPGSLPSGDIKTMQWQTPERGYLSQVDAQLLPAMLPAEEKTYGFFVYHPDSSRLAIRVMRVVPRDGGGKIVYVRPTIDLAEQAMEFDANGELVRWLFPDGRSMVQTTREELARIWNVRVPRD
ncbi:MAG: hypothetical protein ACIAXF_04540 [Phycisphaerales bacterium JB063]